jgi:2-dehydro-3-deoxyphosphooctonate aldolase (KDO 8-P synthase)
MAAGADGVFMECHPEPLKAKSDAANAFLLSSVGPFVRQLLSIHNVAAPMDWTLPVEYRT